VSAEFSGTGVGAGPDATGAFVAGAFPVGCQAPDQRGCLQADVRYRVCGLAEWSHRVTSDGDADCLGAAGADHGIDSGGGHIVALALIEHAHEQSRPVALRYLEPHWLECSESYRTADCGRCGRSLRHGAGGAVAVITSSGEPCASVPAVPGQQPAAQDAVTRD